MNAIDDDLLGIDEEENKLKGIANFEFDNFEETTISSTFFDIQPKKKEKLIIIDKNDIRNKRNGGSSLF